VIALFRYLFRSLFLYFCIWLSVLFIYVFGLFLYLFRDSYLYVCISFFPHCVLSACIYFRDAVRVFVI